MKKANRQKIDGHAVSLDGMMPLNRSYRPGGRKKLQLGEKLKDKMDGFYPQRANNDISQVGSGGSLAAPPIAVDEPETLDLSKADMPKKTRHIFKRLWPIRRKKSDQKVTGKRAMLKRAGMAFLLLIVAGVIFFGFRFWQTSHDLFHGGGLSTGLDRCRNVNNLKNEGDCRINILLLGIGGPGHDGSDLTDTILLASIDPVNNTAALLSIPRDLWVQVSGYGSQKVNNVYYDGLTNSPSKSASDKKLDGFKLLDKTLSSVIGVNINYHVIVDFKAFKAVVDDLGGVDIDVKSNQLNYPYGSSRPTQLYDPTIAWENNNNPVIAKLGKQTMNGKQALLFARSRETSSDFARSQRQQALLVAIGKKVLTLGTFSNPVKVSKLMTSFGSNVFTDIPLSAVNPFYSLALQIPTQDIASLSMTTTPGNLLTTGNINGASVVVPVAGTFDYSQVIPFVRSTLRDGQLAYENASVAVYNATTIAGLATDHANILKSYGYRVVDTNSAPNSSNPSATIVVDLTGGKNPYTRHYLERRYKTTATTNLPNQYGIKPKSQAGFVIILGQDASTASSSPATAG